LLSLPAGTEMFHFPALPPAALCIQAAATPHDGCRVSPFGNPRINARLPAPRGLSQAPASFIGSWCQDIHRVLLETWLKITQRPDLQKIRSLDARVHCAVLKIRTGPRVLSPHPGAFRLGRSKVSSPQRSGCFLRTQQRAHPAGRSVRSFRGPAEAGKRTDRAFARRPDE
jgi:hypothetical protein